MIFTNKRILLIDDDRLTCRTLSQLLLRQGFSWVESINDSRDAVSAVEHSAPDLIVLDVMMPYVNGLEVLQRLAEKGLLENSRVLVLTAMEDDVAKEKAMSYGATDFITKPITPDRLVYHIENALATVPG